MRRLSLALVLCFTAALSPAAIAPASAQAQVGKAPAGGQTPTIRTGRFNCPLTGLPTDVTLTKNSYRIASGGQGRIAFVARESDPYTGGFVRYAITGGPFDGFFFRHLDNGDIHLGRIGWTRCEPK
jgi:hypothetical protein